MDAGDAVAVFQTYYDGPLNRDTLGQAYRAAVLATHPDRGGSQKDFERVTQAKEVLERVL